MVIVHSILVIIGYIGGFFSLIMMASTIEEWSRMPKDYAQIAAMAGVGICLWIISKEARNHARKIRDN